MPYSRSPELLDSQSSALLVVDVQAKLVSHVRESKRLLWNIGRLLRAAKLFDIPASATEQYPKGLGGTAPELAEHLGTIPEKLLFSCLECQSLVEQWKEAARPKIVVVGIETHVCVQQTVLDLIHIGFRPYVVSDAVSARATLDHDTAIRRMELSGAVITTTESVMFEWCQAAGTPQFKQISALVRENAPL